MEGVMRAFLPSTQQMDCPACQTSHIAGGTHGCNILDHEFAEDTVHLWINHQWPSSCFADDDGILHTDCI